ncbi:MAG: AraC family transcriptional regulator [Clostridia bacterium]
MKIEHDMRDVAYDMHFHPAYELILVLRGRMRIIFGARAYEAGPNTLVCINHLEAHALRVLETPYERYFAILPPQEADRWICDGVLLSLFKNRPSTFQHVLSIERIASEVTFFFDALQRTNLQSDSAYYQERMACLLRLLLMTVYHDQPAAFPLIDPDTQAPVFQIQQYIDTHFAECIAIQALADQFYWSVSRMTHCFKLQTGLSPKQYLTLTRLAYARSLLLHGGVSVAETAFRAGFGDVNNFIRRFKMEYGQTPKQMQQQKSLAPFAR